MLIFKKKPKAASDEINEPLTPKPEYDDMIQKIKEKFRVQDDAYVYEFKDDKLGDYLVHYMEFADLLTLTKFEVINYYDDVLGQLEGRKGILYLDSGNHFKIME